VQRRVGSFSSGDPATGRPTPDQFAHSVRLAGSSSYRRF
jgi:hypothetical protein